MASIAFLATVAILFITTTSVLSFYGTTPVCLPPGKDKIFNYACSDERTLPDPGQDTVLSFIVDNMFKKIDVDLCTNDSVSQGGEYFVFGGCNNVFTTEACKNCVADARNVILNHCPNAVGAQAAATNCCIRYETYRFC